jgi:hypothetical protein
MERDSSLPAVAQNDIGEESVISRESFDMSSLKDFLPKQTPHYPAAKAVSWL